MIACARTVGRLEDLDDAIKSAGGLPATLVPFDRADMAAIDTLGGAINEHWGKLDILVANANVLGAISPVGHVKAKVFEKVMTVNVAIRAQAILGEDPSTVPHRPKLQQSSCRWWVLIRRKPASFSSSAKTASSITACRIE